MNGIDKLLDEYSSRVSRAKEAAAAKQERDAELRTRARQILAAVVAHQVKEVSASIVSKGHKSEVRESLAENICNPGIELTFAPSSDDHCSGLFPSSLRFSLADSGGSRFSVIAEVKAPGGGIDGTHTTRDTWEFSQVLEEKVKPVLFTAPERISKAIA